MVFNYGMLKNKIKQVFGTQANFAQKADMSLSSLNQKLNNVAEFTVPEIYLCCKLLGINKDEIPAYFFYPMSSETRTAETKNKHTN